jgi:hypothetical protein
MPRTRRAHAAALAAAALACCAARGVSGALPLTFSHATRNAAGGFFAAADCGASPSVLTLQSLSLSPDPLLLGAPFNYSLAFTVREPVAAPVQARACACTASSCAARALTPLSVRAQLAVLLRRRSGPVLLTLPCVPLSTGRGGGGRVSVGSCTYDDACALLPGATSDEACAAGAPCACPLQPGSYAVAGTQLLAVPGAPSWLTSVREEGLRTMLSRSFSAPTHCF